MVTVIFSVAPCSSTVDCLPEAGLMPEIVRIDMDADER
jgi:hypothetical protein